MAPHQNSFSFYAKTCGTGADPDEVRTVILQALTTAYPGATLWVHSSPANYDEDNQPLSDVVLSDDPND